MLDEFGNCIDVPATPIAEPEPLTCDISKISVTSLIIACSEKVTFLETNHSKLFEFEVEGKREVYQFQLDLITNLENQVLKIEYLFKPESTYIGLNEEVMRVKFLLKDKIVAVANSTKSLSNSESEKKIPFESDAIPPSADTLSKTIAKIIGIGSIATIALDFTSKFLLGFYTTMGGYIDLIQIVSFIPLLELYFPGNVRSYASVLKYANVAGKGVFNPFFEVINEDDLVDEPYNFRFRVMGIESKIFIKNFGFQLSTILGMIIGASFVQYLKSRCFTDARGRPINRNSFFGLCFTIAHFCLNFNGILRTGVILSMFAFMTSLTTVVDSKFENPSQFASYAIAGLGFLGLILFV